MKVGKETWWWGEEVQKRIRDKKEANKKLFEDNADENRANYKRANKQAKKAVAVAKVKAYHKLYEDLDTTEGTKKVLRIAKQKEKSSKDIYQTRQIKSEDGDMLVKDEEITKRWQTYFTRLMNEENPREVREEVQEDNLDEMEAITEDEVRSALKKMKNGKVVGPDNLPIEFWKCLGEEGTTFLCEMLNKICEEEHIPEAWLKSTLIPIYKNKGEIMSCCNYRGIKLIEGHKELHGMFIDLEKAYDRVPWEELYWCMQAKNVPEKYIWVVQDMHQGSALSPFLFAIIMDTLTDDIRKEAPWSMMFTDDVVLCCEEKAGLEEDLER